MKIGINCFNIHPKYRTALNAFTFELLDGLLKTGRNHSFVLFIRGTDRRLFEKYVSMTSCTIVELPKESKSALFFRGLAVSLRSESLHRVACDFFYRKICKEINSRDVDIFYTPTNFLFPYKIDAAKLVTIHEVQHLHHSDLFKKYDLLNRSLHFRNTAKLVDYIAVANETIKNDVAASTRISPEKIVSLPAGINVDFYSQSQGNEDVLKKYNLPQYFLFYPAQLWRHKGHLTILRSILLLNDMYKVNAPFVFTGTKTASTQYVFDFIDQNKMKDVYYLGAIPQEDMIALMQRARYFITASQYESGYGQILEAASSGAPIIAARIPIVEEIAKEMKLNLFEKGDHESLTSLLLNIWSDSTIRQIQSHHNEQVVRDYSWKNAAEKYIALFERIGSRR